MTMVSGVTLWPGRGIMVREQKRALRISRSVAGNRTKSAVGQVLESSLWGHLTNAWSGRDP